MKTLYNEIGTKQDPIKFKYLYVFSPNYKKNMHENNYDAYITCMPVLSLIETLESKVKNKIYRFQKNQRKSIKFTRNKSINFRNNELVANKLFKT